MVDTLRPNEQSSLLHLHHGTPDGGSNRSRRGWWLTILASAVAGGLLHAIVSNTYASHPQPQASPLMLMATKTNQAKPCDETAPSSDPTSCAYYYTKHTALSVKPNPCGPGEMQVSKPPDWWHICEEQTGACPQGCGTCKKPNNGPGSVGSTQCMCAGSNSVCTAKCGYPGEDDGSTCKKAYCRADDLEKAGCIALGNNCGGSAETKCMDNQGKISVGTCGYSEDYNGNCEAFCTQVPFTDKCETVRWDASSSPVVGTSPCTKHAMTYIATSGDVNGCAYVGGIHFVDDQFSRCPSPNVCPYNSEEKYQCGQCNSSKPPTIEPDAPPLPDQCCPMAKNPGSEGIPALFTDPRVPLDASITCEAACACNKKHGYGPPDCYQPGEPWPSFLSKCYCDGHNIAYDKTKFDQCGYYLPIFGEGVIPSQYKSYADYAKENGLDNAYPAPITTMCKPVDDSSFLTLKQEPASSTSTKKQEGPPSWWGKCAGQGGSCPTGCGSCTAPQPGSQCMCSKSRFVTCTTECGHGQN